MHLPLIRTLTGMIPVPIGCPVCSVIFYLLVIWTFWVFSSLTNQFIDLAGISGIDAAPPNSTVGSTYYHPLEYSHHMQYVLINLRLHRRTIDATAVMTFYLYLLNICTPFAPVQHHVIGSSIYPAALILKLKMSVFCLQQHFYIFHVGFVCSSHTASSKQRTERTMPICSIVPQVPRYV